MGLEGLMEKVTFEQKPEGSKGCLVKVFQAEERASAKALRQEPAWDI